MEGVVVVGVDLSIPAVATAVAAVVSAVVAFSAVVEAHFVGFELCE